MKDMNIDIAFRLIRLLNSYDQINYKTIMNELEVSRKTAYRYLDKLAQHFPVYAPKEGVKSFRLIKDYRFDNVQGSTDFAFIASLMDYAKSVIAEEYRVGIEELKQRLFSAERYATHMLIKDRPEDYNAVAKTANQLEKFILSHSVISFYYSRKEKDYTVRPYKILYYSGTWYLLAEHENIFKTFLLDAMEEMADSGDSFKPDYEAMERYSEKMTNIWQHFDHPSETVLVRINKEISDNFKRRQILPEQKIIREYKDGGIELTFSVTNEMELKHFPMPWFPDFKIIKPKKYKDLINDYVERFNEG